MQIKRSRLSEIKPQETCLILLTSGHKTPNEMIQEINEGKGYIAQFIPGNKTVNGVLEAIQEDGQFLHGGQQTLSVIDALGVSFVHTCWQLDVVARVKAAGEAV